MILLWPKIEEHEFNSSLYMHMQFKSLCDYAKSLMLIFYVVSLFWVIEICKSAVRKWSTAVMKMATSELPLHLGEEAAV